MNSPKHETTHWKSRDELDIFGQYWKSEGPEKAVIALVHGFGEHSNRYHHVAKAFNQRGYSVFAFDHRGHGQSKGQRGHTPTYESLMQDMDVFMEKVADHFPDVPVILYGHSMGGNIVTNYVISREPDVVAAVVTGPFYRTAEPPPKFQMMLGKAMLKIWPAFPDKAKLDVNHISRDKEVVDIYDNDPMVHNKISASMGIALIKNGEAAIQNADRVKIPFLIMHGGDDKLTSVDGSKEFKANAGDHVILEVLDDYYHEIHNDPGKEVVIKRIIDFCDDQL